MQPVGDGGLVELTDRLDRRREDLTRRVGVGGVLARGGTELLGVALDELRVARELGLGALGEEREDALGVRGADRVG